MTDNETRAETNMRDTLGIEVRSEQPGDEAAVRHVNDLAFGQSDESRIVDAVRAAGAAVISLVAVRSTRIVGHILFTPVSLDPPAPEAALGLGPMAVLPDLQRQGIGSRLVEAGLHECRRMGYPIVVVVGHPEFYPRFGFRPGSVWGLRSEFDVPDEVFMATELTPGAMAGGNAVV